MDRSLRRITIPAGLKAATRVHLTRPMRLGSEQRRIAAHETVLTADWRRRSSTNDAPLDQVRAVTSKVEDAIDTNFRWVKPYLPVLGRFLIVVTFLEDALR